MSEFTKLLTNAQLASLRRDLMRVYCSDLELARKYKISLAVVRRVKEHQNAERQFLPIVYVCGFEKKTPYYEAADGLTSEDIMISSPYYNPLELRGQELKIYKKSNT